MSQYHIVMLETSGIQDFIFGSNNLRVNTGASALADAITREWVPALLPTPNNVDGQGRVTRGSLEDGRLAVEAIYVGGGNALLMFTGTPDEFLQRLSSHVLTKAPGLRVVSAVLPIGWKSDSLVGRLSELRQTLAQRKHEAAPSGPLPGLGVTAACVFTGEPATGEWLDPGGQTKLVSESVWARLSWFDRGQQRLKSLVDDNYVSSFDHFGTKGESSYIAIVHGDGNRMGDRIENLGKTRAIPSMNREYANLLREFSDSARKAAETALGATIETLSRCRTTEGLWQRQKDVTARDKAGLPRVSQRCDEEGRPLLPFRPVVFGGDDVTFVSDGRLGLALAHCYLELYSRQQLADGQRAVGRAGVAIVNTHFPFSLGYALAEALAASAKEPSEDGHAPTMDWHFGVNGVVGSLSEIRRVAYNVRSGSLLMRPVRVEAGTDWRHWNQFCDLVNAFQLGEQWRDRRNKLKALQRALRGGAEDVRAFRNSYRIPELPTIMGHEDFKSAGWQGGRCGYFDALEALDSYVPLEEP